MPSLLRSEWYQIRKTVWIKLTYLITIIVGLVVGCNMMGESYVQYFKESHKEYMLYVGGNLMGGMEDRATCFLFSGLFAGFIISSAFENRMIQDAISCGKSRTKVFLAKMGVYLLIVTGACMAYWFSSAVASHKNGLGTFEMAGNLSQVKYVVGMVFAATLAYVSLFSICGVIAFLNRKIGATIGICMVVILFGGSLLSSILPDSLQKYVSYTPLGLYQSVLKLDVTGMDVLKTSVISLVWIVVICGIGLWKFRKTELK